MRFGEASPAQCQASNRMQEMWHGLLLAFYGSVTGCIGIYNDKGVMADERAHLAAMLL